ncbi:helix-turn-helix domain-containing protein [Longispora albida]|uniref:helix-turn-helix domain-containing protein n=1 Tax=Longispora albida TaxID=203523 RepID=UPI0012F77C88|nr:helix-turn-helix transcriptional regulator [Longispora albida]
MIKAVRESVPLSQEHLAEDLGVDRTTLQSWESGRRPLSQTTIETMSNLRDTFLRLGADMAIFGSLHDALEADRLLATLIDQDPATCSLDRHPLGSLVLNRSTTSRGSLVRN